MYSGTLFSVKPFHTDEKCTIFGHNFIRLIFWGDSTNGHKVFLLQKKIIGNYVWCAEKKRNVAYQHFSVYTYLL
jgi:hypothetical protein